MSDEKQRIGAKYSPDDVLAETMRELDDLLLTSDTKEKNGNGEVGSAERPKKKRKKRRKKTVEKSRETGEAVGDSSLSDSYDDGTDKNDEELEIEAPDMENEPEQEYAEISVDDRDYDDGDIDMEDGESGREKKPKKGILKKILKKILIVLLVLIALAAIAYAGVAFYFKSHFHPYTKINGADFSVKTVEEVAKHMEEQVDNYVLTLKKSDGATEVIRGADIGLRYAGADDLKKLLDDQNPFLWVKSFWEAPEIEAPVGVEYDEAKLTEAIESLECMNVKKQTKPESAKPVFENNQFVIKPEIYGNQINEETFIKAVGTAISGFNDTLDMAEADCYVKPKYTAESEEVIAAAEKMNSYLKAAVTYNFNPETEVVDAAAIGQWVTVDKDMKVTFSKKKVKEYIAGLAEKYDTAGKTRTMTTGSGNTAEVSGGDYGWRIDQDAEYKTLVANIESGKAVEREPEYASRAVNHSGQDWGDTYVEVDLSGQHMWMFVNGKCIVESDIVTGNPNKGHATPQGVYALYYKQRDTTLVGQTMPNGKPEYETPVSYWMPFNGGIGLHDAYWQPTFGGNWYQNNGSHGCVNLPPDVAAKVYENIEAGTPVVCHF